MTGDKHGRLTLNALDAVNKPLTKDYKKTKYESSFQSIAPVLLQTMSFERPLITLSDDDFNYSYMEAYSKAKEEYPEHLVTHAGQDPKEGFEVSKMFWPNLDFVDSKEYAGMGRFFYLSSNSPISCNAHSFSPMVRT